MSASDTAENITESAGLRADTIDQDPGDSHGFITIERPFKRLQVRSTEENSITKLVISPVEQEKSLARINALKIAKEINQICGQVKSVKKVGHALAFPSYRRWQYIVNATP